MKLLAQLINKLPQDAQNMVLNELHSQVAESDDVIRKPILVSWLQSLSYLCTKALQENGASKKSPSEDHFTLAHIADPRNWVKLTSRLWGIQIQCLQKEPLLRLLYFGPCCHPSKLGEINTTALRHSDRAFCSGPSLLPRKFSCHQSRQYICCCIGYKLSWFLSCCF